MKWELYSYVVRSKQRKDIVVFLKEPKTPTQIAKELKLSTSHVSRTITQFVNKGIVRCLTPNERAGRVYELTEEGKEISKQIK